jgi:hypothetical protein
MISRRSVAQGSFVLALGAIAAPPARAVAGSLPAELARLEAESGARLGVAVRASANGAQAGHRG